MAGCGDVLTLEDLQTAKKHQVFEAEVITGKAGGVAGGANIQEATNQVTGQVQTTLPEVLDNAQRVLETVGYNFIGEYASGLVLNSTKDMISYEGLRYANSGPFPKTTTGNFSADGPWVLIPMATGAFLFAFVASAGQTTYQISAPISPGTAPFVFRRGVYQQFGIAYTISPLDGRTFQFSQSLDAGDEVQIIATTGSDSVIKGDYQVFVYRNAATAPTTPTGVTPVGWTSAPQTPTPGQLTWVSTVRKSGNDNSLIGLWSTPSRFSGEVGAQGVSVVDIVEVSSDATSTTYKMLLSNGLFTSEYVVPKGEQGEQGIQGIQGIQGVQGVSVVDVVEVSSDATSITYKFELSDGAFTSNYVVPKGASVQELELVSKIGKVATYRFLLTNGAFTDTFVVNDGLDGAGSVVSVNGVSPDVSGDVTLTAADVGADATGSAATAISDHVALADPHAQYDYRWATTTTNTGELSGSKRVRWLADTSAARNRTIGSDVTDLLVKDATGQAATNNVTITAPVGKTINGAATEVVDVNYGWVQYTLVGTDFKTTGGQ